MNFESAHKFFMNLNLNFVFLKSMNLNFIFSKSMNLNLNFVFSKSMNLNFKIRKKMNGSNPSPDTASKAALEARGSPYPIEPGSSASRTTPKNRNAKKRKREDSLDDKIVKLIRNGMIQ